MAVDLCQSYLTKHTLVADVNKMYRTIVEFHMVVLWVHFSFYCNDLKSACSSYILYVNDGAFQVSHKDKTVEKQ